jgi:hypothetical protein
MSDQTVDTKKIIPDDIRDAFSVISTLIEDLDDYTADEAREWLSEVREAYKNSKAGQEVDWQPLREAANEFCKEGGYADLFPDAESE